MTFNARAPNDPLIAILFVLSTIVFANTAALAQEKSASSNTDKKETNTNKRQEVSIQFKSKKNQTKVLVDGDIVCKSTPFTRKVSTGEHKISMSRESYKRRTETLSLTSDKTVNWTLEPQLVDVLIQHEPGSDVSVYVDGKKQKGNPIFYDHLTYGVVVQVRPGRHKFSVKRERKCYPKKL